ncbi:MAG: amino-acid N-acetyltransferase [Planctomycetes bacterium]|nr:amino-acid N-acetyltransferase [Planctomycetota bacterium]
MATSDLRNVLRYVPQFRDKVFVIAIDSQVVADDNFGNVLLDVAALHSLSIHLVIVHGASAQIREWSEQLKEAVTDADGTGPCDAATLRIARLAAAQVGNRILDGLFGTHELRGAVPNAIKAKPAGVLKGVDHLYRGRVDQVDVDYLRLLLQHDIVPVIPPIGTDGSGQPYRLNSDEVAEEVARELQAVKLIFLTTKPGVEVEGRVLRQISSRDLEELLDTRRDQFAPAVVSKVEAALRSCKGGVRRAHIIDGRVDECLLSEVYSNEGIGTMVHANEYQFIRRAQPRDVSFIWALVKPAMEKEELLRRTRASIQKQITDYYVFETDGAILGCVALHVFSEEKKAEMASLHVSPLHENRGIGTRLARYVEELARKQGVESLYCLSTQAFSFFQQKLGFEEVSPDFLTTDRRAKYFQSARNSKVLAKSLLKPPAPIPAG